MTERSLSARFVASLKERLSEARARLSETCASRTGSVLDPLQARCGILGCFCFCGERCACCA